MTQPLFHSRTFDEYAAIYNTPTHRSQPNTARKRSGNQSNNQTYAVLTSLPKKPASPETIQRRLITRHQQILALRIEISELKQTELVLKTKIRQKQRKISENKIIGKRIERIPTPNKQTTSIKRKTIIKPDVSEEQADALIAEIEHLQSVNQVLKHEVEQLETKLHMYNSALEDERDLKEEIVQLQRDYDDLIRSEQQMIDRRAMTDHELHTWRTEVEAEIDRLNEHSQQLIEATIVVEDKRESAQTENLRLEAEYERLQEKLDDQIKERVRQQIQQI